MEFSMRFVNQFMEFSFLQKARNSAVQDWGEDIPMTVLFSILGKGMAENFAQLSPSSRSRIFHLIEEELIPLMMSFAQQLPRDCWKLWIILFLAIWKLKIMFI